MVHDANSIKAAAVQAIAIFFILEMFLINKIQIDNELIRLFSVNVQSVNIFLKIERLSIDLFLEMGICGVAHQHAKPISISQKRALPLILKIFCTFA